MSEHIYLRALWVEFSQEESSPGVMLPDGRILVWSGTRLTSIVSEAALAVEYPGARLYFNPDADAGMNYTEARQP
jgi:hypothetical protein